MPICAILYVEYKKLDQYKILLLDRTAKVNQRIAHTTQSCVDAHVGLLGNLGKRQLVVVAQTYHLLLLVGKQSDKFAYGLLDLAVHDIVLGSRLREAHSADNIIASLRLVDLTVALLAAEVVENTVVGDA